MKKPKKYFIAFHQLESGDSNIVGYGKTKKKAIKRAKKKKVDFTVYKYKNGRLVA